jgi:transcriptional regulator with XRE-family HTH domain
MNKNKIEEHNQKRLQSIGMFLREFRINSGLTQEEVSQFSSPHRNTIVRAETARNISLLKLFEIMDALGLEPREVFLDID